MTNPEPVHSAAFGTGVPSNQPVALTPDDVSLFYFPPGITQISANAASGYLAGASIYDDILTHGEDEILWTIGGIGPGSEVDDDFNLIDPGDVVFDPVIDTQVATYLLNMWDELIVPDLMQAPADGEGADIGINIYGFDVLFGIGAAYATALGQPIQVQDPNGAPGETIADIQITSATANFLDEADVKDFGWTDMYQVTQDGQIVFNYGEFYIQAFHHEIGHALGFPEVTTASQTWIQDTDQYTVMSYENVNNNNSTADFRVFGEYQNPATPMIFDIYAIQYAYGANYDTRSGDTTYGFNSNAGDPVFDFTINQTPVITIWDGGGVDTLDASGFTFKQTISLVDGSYSSLGGIGPEFLNKLDMKENVGIAANAVIENAIGGIGDDQLWGNGADNLLQGGDGADTLIGNVVSIDADGNKQSDYIADINLAFSLADYSGYADADTLQGGAGADRLDGGVGNDLLQGGSGSDLVFGGDGDDTIWGETGSDIVDAGAGNDVIVDGADSSVITGGAGQDTLFGGTAASELSGGDGDDLLIGGIGIGQLLLGDVGNDTLTGGKVIGQTLDGGEGDDIIRLSGTADGLEVEGGDGFDTLILASSTLDAAIGGAVDETGQIDLSYLTIGPDGLIGSETFSVSGVESFIFANGTFTEAEVSAAAGALGEPSHELLGLNALDLGVLGIMGAL